MTNEKYEKYLNAFKPSDKLLEKHINDLKKSGIDEVTALELGFRTSVASDSWVVPIRNIENTETLGYVARYDNEAIEENKYPSKKKNTTPKYRLSPELRNSFFYPHIKSVNWLKIAKDSTLDIGMTEGIKKAIKLTLEGFPTIGLFATYGWIGKNQEEESKENGGLDNDELDSEEDESEDKENEEE